MGKRNLEISKIQNEIQGINNEITKINRAVDREDMIFFITPP